MAETPRRRQRSLALLTLVTAGWLLPGAAVPSHAATPPASALAPNPPPAPVDARPAQAGAQILALQQQVGVVLDEARRQQDQLGLLHQRLAAAEAARAWLPALGLALLSAMGVAAWLGVRLRRLQRELQRRGRPPAHAESTGAGPHAGAAPGPAASRLIPQRPMLSADAIKAASAAAPLSSTVDRSVPVERASPSAQAFSLATAVPPRPVSVEEMIDLEQQVEFFLVLGQEQSAIDLLLNHMRATGGTSALPYFKLLEIYRRQRDEEAYDRTRERFNQRFNAHAPDWSGELTGGRSLEDYAEVMARLQRAWPQPGRAVAEIESLLLRRADLEPLDLPAYRELLMLQALALDLPASPSAAAEPLASHRSGTYPAAPSVRPGDTVDVPLPLDEGPMEITSPRPHRSERTSAQAMLADWVFTRATTPLPPGSVAMSLPSLDVDALDDPQPDPDPFDVDAALDLDLSEFAPAPREFTRPAAFTDIDMRRDSRLSDLAFDDPDSDSQALPPLR